MPSIRIRGVEIAVAQVWDTAEGYADEQRRYAREAAGLATDLEAAGFRVDRLRELHREGVGEARALPILLDWLRRVPCSPLKRDICYALGSRWARPGAIMPLVREYRRLDGRADVCAAQTRAAICTALERIADDSAFDEIVGIAVDPARRPERSMAAGRRANRRRSTWRTWPATRGRWRRRLRSRRHRSGRAGARARDHLRGGPNRRSPCRPPGSVSRPVMARWWLPTPVRHRPPVDQG